MKLTSTAASLALAGLLLVGCKDDSTETTPQDTADQVQRQVDNAVGDIGRQTDRLANEAQDRAAQAQEQATEAAGQMQGQFDQVLQSVDAETRQQFQQLRQAITDRDWSRARQLADQLQAKSSELGEAGRQLLNSLRSQIPQGD